MSEPSTDERVALAAKFVEHNSATLDTDGVYWCDGCEKPLDELAVPEHTQFTNPDLVRSWYVAAHQSVLALAARPAVDVEGIARVIDPDAFMSTGNRSVLERVFAGAAAVRVVAYLAGEGHDV